MADDAQELVGTWTVKFMQWTWEYTFTADDRVTWRDPLNNENGAGRWTLMGKIVHFSWTGSSTKETWNRPIKPDDQEGWSSASYGSDKIKATKTTAARPPSNPPKFIKDPDTGAVGSKFTAAGQLWRQEIELGSSATVALENYSGLTVGLNNPNIAKLVKWYYNNVLYVDIVPTGLGDANLEARSGDAVLTFIQINISSNANGAIYVDDFAGSYYNVDYRHAGGNLSKWIILEYRDSVVIDINIDDISDTPSKPNTGEGFIGAGGRRFPSRLDRMTTPRLYAAKKHAIELMNKNYADFLESAKDGIFFILTINPLVAPVEQPTSIRPVRRGNLPRPVATHVEGAATSKPYVNLNKGATTPESSLGVWLDGEAQSGKLGLIKRVRGMPEAPGPGGNPDYHLFFSDIENVELNKLPTSPNLRGDAVIAESNNINSIIKNAASSKSSRQAEVVFIEIGTRGQSGQISDEAIRAWKLNDIKTTFPRLRRLVVIRNNGGARNSVLDLEVR